MSGFGYAHASWRDDSRFGADEFAVLAMLATYADCTGFCFPSQATLAEKLKKPRAWVNRVIGRIVRLAPDVLLKRHTQGVNHYWLLGHTAIQKIVRKNRRPSEVSNVPQEHSGSASSGTPDVSAAGHKHSQSSLPSNSRAAAEPEPESRPAPPPDTWGGKPRFEAERQANQEADAAVEAAIEQGETPPLILEASADVQARWAEFAAMPMGVGRTVLGSAYIAEQRRRGLRP